VDWIHPAQDTDQWWALLSTVITFELHKRRVIYWVSASNSDIPVSVFEVLKKLKYSTCGVGTGSKMAESMKTMITFSIIYLLHGVRLPQR
jgi:uncharacterized membrane protein YjjP (DUF1212 family)